MVNGFVNSYSTGSVSVLIGNGDGTFQNPVSYAAGSNPQAIATADMNQDGHLDLVAVWVRARRRCFWAMATERFSRPLSSVRIPAPSGGGPVTLAVGDVNGDGLPDIVLQDNSGYPNLVGSMTVLLNQTGITPVKTTVTLSSSLNPAASGQDRRANCHGRPLWRIRRPAGSVTFLNGTTALGTVALSGGTATWSSSALAVGSYTITASYAGNPHFTGSSSSAVVQVVNPCRLPQLPPEVRPRQSRPVSQYICVSFMPGTAATQTVSLSCSGGPPASTCMVSPNSVTLSGTAASTATVTVQTSSANAAAGSHPAAYALALAYVWHAFFAVFFELARDFAGLSGLGNPLQPRPPSLRLSFRPESERTRRRSGGTCYPRYRLSFLGLLLAVALLPGCGSGSSGSGGKGGTYPVVVTAQSGSFSQQVNLTLTVQ